MGAEHHWFFAPTAQTVRKLDANRYETHLEGLKGKIGLRPATSERWDHQDGAPRAAEAGAEALGREGGDEEAPPEGAAGAPACGEPERGRVSRRPCSPSADLRRQAHDKLFFLWLSAPAAPRASGSRGRRCAPARGRARAAA